MKAAAALVAAVLVAAALLIGCGTDTPVVPSDRAVALATTACGDASKTSGSGVVIGPGRVLTAAHVVVGATTIDVIVDGASTPAAVTVLDATRDLAIVTVTDPEVLPTGDVIDLAEAKQGDVVSLIGFSSGTVEVAIGRELTMRVDNVRDTGRSLRTGYELEAQLAAGDSGAGVFNGAGELIGIVFAGPVARDGRVFAVNGDEVAAALAADEQIWACSPGDSRIRSDS